MNGKILDVVNRAGNSEISLAAYDTAWVARVPSRNNLAEPAFPLALRWLYHNQNEDGSWGEGAAPEKILATLAAVVALKTFDRPTETNSRKGILFLWNSLIALPDDSSSLPIGFELLLGPLLEEAKRMGLNTPPFLEVAYQKERGEKLAMLSQIPLEKLFYTSAAFSLEFLGKELATVDQFVQQNNLISPAMAAALLIYTKDIEKKNILEEYLKTTARVDATGMFWPNLTNFDNFEISWVLYNLYLGGYFDHPLLKDSIKDCLNRLRLNMQLKPEGVAFSSKFPLADSDTSAICFLVLQKGGYILDPATFDSYWKEDHITGYTLERVVPISANIHLMEYYYNIGEIKKGDTLANYLQNQRGVQPYWLDKWNVSPYYPTCHFIIASAARLNIECSKLIEWILSTQSMDSGGWGQPTTLEETAYALQALCIYATYRETTNPIIRNAIVEGYNYLLKNHENNFYPPLWLGKNRYAPQLVVESTIISALNLANTFLSRPKE